MIQVECGEWLDAQDRKKELLKVAETLIEDIPVEISGLDDLEIAAGMLSNAHQLVGEAMAECRRLEEDFPVRPTDPDFAYDDAVWEGDR